MGKIEVLVSFLCCAIAYAIGWRNGFKFCKNQFDKKFWDDKEQSI